MRSRAGSEGAAVAGPDPEAASGAALDTVCVRGVGKLFGRQRALSGVDLTLRPGRVCALLGPNGAGKSTLLGILSTLVRPSSGQVRYEAAGRALDPRTARATIGLLAHEPLVYGELSGIENLEFFGALYDVPELGSRIGAVLDAVGLEPAARARPARTYSRGMLQRLALARSWLHRPRLLLLDEPFTGLDRDGTKALARTLEEGRRDGRLGLVVSHDLEALSGLCHHVVVLRRGRVVLDEARDNPYAGAELGERYRGLVE